MLYNKQIISILLFLCSFLGYSQDSSYYNHDSTIIYLPITIDSTVMSDYYIPKWCKNDLSDSLSILLNSFQDTVFSTTYDSTISYTYQFTKTYNIEIDFQSKLSNSKECFIIEDQRNINEFIGFNNFILYNKNEWLVVIKTGIPNIGNSTYINNSYIYLKKN